MASAWFRQSGASVPFSPTRAGTCPAIWCRAMARKTVRVRGWHALLGVRRRKTIVDKGRQGTGTVNYYLNCGWGLTHTLKAHSGGVSVASASNRSSRYARQCIVRCSSQSRGGIYFRRASTSHLGSTSWNKGVKWLSIGRSRLRGRICLC